MVFIAGLIIGTVREGLGDDVDDGVVVVEIFVKLLICRAPDVMTGLR